jgi:hypothetical protein
MGISFQAICISIGPPPLESRLKQALIHATRKSVGILSASLEMSIQIRFGKVGDLPAIVDIYNYFVLNSIATFDLQPKQVEDRQCVTILYSAVEDTSSLSIDVPGKKVHRFATHLNFDATLMNSFIFTYKIFYCTISLTEMPEQEMVRYSCWKHAISDLDC